MAPLKTKMGALTDGNFQQLLVELVTSPAVGHPKHWVPVMAALMKHLGPNTTYYNGIIQKHSKIANLLATSAQTISSQQIYQFCRYLGQKQLSQNHFWLVYRALEQYSLKLQPNLEGVNKAIKEYLTNKAKKYITTNNTNWYLTNNRILKVQDTYIDSNLWFGKDGASSSLWWLHMDPANRATAPMPELLLDVLWTHIQSLRASCVDRALVVDMTVRSGSFQQIYNFTLRLAQRITNAGIFVEIYDSQIDRRAVNSQFLIHNHSDLSAQELEELATAYPDAVAIRNYYEPISRNFFEM